MPFHPPDNSPSKERILLYGESGAGKTYAWVTIAQMAERTKSDAQFHVIDTENAADEVLHPNSPFAGLAHRIHIHQVFDWEDYLPVAKEISSSVGPNDWVVIDQISRPWGAVQDWWIEEAFGEDDQADYWASMRQAQINDEDGKGFGGMREGIDWIYVKKVYGRWEKMLTIKPRCHVFAVAHEKEVVEQYDKKGKAKEIFGPVGGYMPEGEKSLRTRFHTTIRAVNVGGDRELRMVRDRFHEHVWEKKGVGFGGRTLEVPNSTTAFARGYLMGIRGWKV